MVSLVNLNGESGRCKGLARNPYVWQNQPKAKISVHAIMGKREKILLVDDEPDALELLEYNLQQAGYDILLAEDGNKALKRAREEQPDLILLDVMLPEVDGLKVCKTLRQDAMTSSIPIIMVTAKAAEIDRVVGLELGADDYVTKPFSPRELVLRARNLLARNQQVQSGEKIHKNVGAGLLIIDVQQHQVSYDNEPVFLTATEFKLLAALAQSPGRVLDREKLLQDVWGYEKYIDTRTVDTHMRRLRDKMGPAATCLETVRGVGYRFREDN